VALRLRTDFWVSALRRRVEDAGAYVSIARRGADEAGAVFVIVGRGDGSFDLYGPAPQSVFEEDHPGDRLFSRIVAEASAETTQLRMQQEIRFDPDLWLIDIEDKQGRAFVDLVPDAVDDRFTSR
jgi:hypothetical protein